MSSEDSLGGTDSIPPRDTAPAVPPYDGRRTEADVDGEGTHRDGARVGGATGPVTDDEFKAPEPAETPRGGVASPADERPAGEQTDADRAEAPPTDPGVGPGHSAGTARAEDQP